MNKDISMQHMTMTEYVAIAMMTELATKDAILRMITDGQTTSTKVIETCFTWADVFMRVRAARTGNEGATERPLGTSGAQAEPTTSSGVNNNAK